MREAEQVRRAQGGDSAAFDGLVARFQNRAVAYAYGILSDRFAAEDAAQEAFLQAWRDLPTLTTPAAFPGWLRAIVFKYANRTQRRKKLHTIALCWAEQTAADTNATDPETQAVFGNKGTGDREATLREAIGTLMPNERSATLLHYIGGHSQNEIADFLGVPVTTIRKRMERARTRLKERMLIMLENSLRENAPSHDTRFVELVRLLRRIVDTLEADERVAAAYLRRFGSDGMEVDDDGWNSLNLYVVFDDAAMDGLATGRRAFAARVADLLLYEEAAQNAPPFGYYLMALYDGEAGPYEVDWYWHGRAGAVIPADARILFNRGEVTENGESPPWGYLSDAQIPAALRAVWARQTPEEKRAEGARNTVSLFWAMLMIAAKHIARDPHAPQLGLGGMLPNLLRDTRATLGDPDAANIPDTPDPLLTDPAEKLAWLRERGGAMKTLMPRVAALGGDIPGAVPARAYRFLDMVAETLLIPPGR